MDPTNAQAAINAVRSGQMSYRQAATTFGVSRNSINSRLKARVSTDGHSGVPTVLTTEEEDSIEISLLRAARHYLGVGRAAVVECIRVLCNDECNVPWDNGVEGATYAATDSSFMQGTIFIDFLMEFDG